MTWPTFGALSLVLLFVTVILVTLLLAKRIDSENTIRFACITVVIVIIVIVSFVLIPSSTVSTGLIGLAGTIIGYIIRDIAKAREGE